MTHTPRQFICDYCPNEISEVEHNEGGLCLQCRMNPLDADQRLITHLHIRFGYTEDNNPDLIADATFSTEEVAEELMVQHAYSFLIAYLIRNPDQR